jgi:hypothetical protein
MGVMCLVAHHVTRHYTLTHNILSTAPQLNISQKALGTLLEYGNVMPKHVGAYLFTPWSRVLLEKLTICRS